MAGGCFSFRGSGLNYADRTALYSVIPPLRDDLGATDAQIGLAGLLFLWSYAIASPFDGNISDKFSRSRIIFWSILVWSLITLVTGFTLEHRSEIDAVQLLAARASTTSPRLQFQVSSTAPRILEFSPWPKDFILQRATRISPADWTTFSLEPPAGFVLEGEAAYFRLVRAP
mgnify:CR=1 FL=1